MDCKFSWESLENDKTKWIALEKMGVTYKDLKDGKVVPFFENEPDNEEDRKRRIYEIKCTIQAHSENYKAEANDKAFECERSILKHIKDVKNAFKTYGDDICRILKIDQDVLAKLVEGHDNSQLSKEFDLMRVGFYPTSYDSQYEIEVSQKYYFMLHHNSNSHHPEFWVGINGQDVFVLSMPDIAIAEMLLDLISCITDEVDIKTLWKNFKSNKPMVEETIEKAEMVLNSLFDMPSSEQ